jgi:fibronectin type 3 domain-containing protein
MSLSVVFAAAMVLQTCAVTLNWQPPAAPPGTVVGYNVYRTDAGSSKWVKINSDVVRSATYKDGTVQHGHSYSYYVRSVNAKGNESEPSKQWSVTVPKEKPDQKANDAKQAKQ